MAVIVAVGLAGWRYAEMPNWPEWIRHGLGVGVAVGLGASFALAVIQVANELNTKVLQALKLRISPEAEFVQSTVLAIPVVEAAATPEPQKGARENAVFWVEYTAEVLETNVRCALASNDPPSALVIADELSRRADCIRVHKQALLFGQPEAGAKLISALVKNACDGARRDWLALPATKRLQYRREPKRQRAVRILVQLTMLALPVALAIISVVLDQPGFLPFAVLWIVVQALELARPGAGDQLAKSASNAQKLPMPDVAGLTRRGT
jgi:hypothetical protein